MKIKNGFMLRSVSDAYVVIPVGEAGENFSGIITLNETGAFLWEKLGGGMPDEESLVSALLEEYDVTAEQAKKDVSAFVKKLDEADILE